MLRRSFPDNPSNEMMAIPTPIMNTMAKMSTAPASSCPDRLPVRGIAMRICLDSQSIWRPWLCLHSDAHFVYSTSLSLADHDGELLGVTDAIGVGDFDRERVLPIRAEGLLTVPLMTPVEALIPRSGGQVADGH